MYLMAVIDGTTSSSELHVLEALLTSLPEFSASSISELVAESKAIVKKYGGTIDSLEALADVDGMKARISVSFSRPKSLTRQGASEKLKLHF